MKCNKVLKLLSLYQDEELEKSIRDEITNHIKQCNSCEREFKKLNRIGMDIISLKEIEPHEDFTTNVMSVVKGIKDKWSFGKSVYIYSSVFTLFFILGILLNPFASIGISREAGRETISTILLGGQKSVSGDPLKSAVVELTGEKDEKKSV